jgi:hypothetical protein
LIRISRHFESAGFVSASPDAVFSYVDDHERLSSHMTRSSWMMGGGRMDVKMDAGRGRRLGSRIQMSGRAFGLQLSLEEFGRRIRSCASQGVEDCRPAALADHWRISNGLRYLAANWRVEPPSLHRLRAAPVNTRSVADREARFVVRSLVHAAHGQRRRCPFRTPSRIDRLARAKIARGARACGSNLRRNADAGCRFPQFLLFRRTTRFQVIAS